MKAKLNIKSNNSVENVKLVNFLYPWSDQACPTKPRQGRAQDVSTVPGRVALIITVTTLSLHNRIVLVISFRIIKTLIIKLKIIVSLGLSTA